MTHLNCLSAKAPEDPLKFDRDPFIFIPQSSKCHLLLRPYVFILLLRRPVLVRIGWSRERRLYDWYINKMTRSWMLSIMSLTHVPM